MSSATETPVRHKRSSLHIDSSMRKRRKVEQAPGSKSPALHTYPPKPVMTPPTSFKRVGLPLLFGTGDIGQLGFGPDICERSRPTRFTNKSLPVLNLSETELETSTVQVCAGGMHTVLLTAAGRVITFGCNDEGALGRPVSSGEDQSGASEEPMEVCSNGDPVSRDAITGEAYPAYVPLPLGLKITMVSAGDSHTAALDSDGQVWIWGTFRGPSGPIGLTQEGEISTLPRRLLDHSSNSIHGHSTDARSMSSHLTPGAIVIKIASGQDHLVCLTEEGRLYTMGSAEQGQLGRIAERFSRTGGRSGINCLLYPTECRVRGTVRFSDAWAGGFATFARCHATGAIYACGLNNYGQLGLKKNVTRHTQNSSLGLDEDEEFGDAGQEEENEGDISVDAALVISDRNEADKSEAALIAKQGPLIQFMLSRARAFDPARGWRQFAVSMHHTLALDNEGHVYAVGRCDYGRLGLGSTVASSNLSVSQPTRVRGLLDECRCVWIGSGEACSFAVDDKGTAYSWGIASNRQLGHGSEDDEDCVEPGIVSGKQLQDRSVSMIDAGGQHTVLLAHSALLPLSESSAEDVTTSDVPADVPEAPSTADIPSFPVKDVMVDPSAKPTSQPTQDEHTLKHPDGLDPQTEPVLSPPTGCLPSTIRRNRHLSPCPVTSTGAGIESTTASSTAGATINSSIHSSAVSETSSVGSCGSSSSSTNSQLNSARSTDGGGSSRCSSFGNFSVQSSLPVGEPPVASAGSSSLMLDPLSASLLMGTRNPPAQSSRMGNVSVNSRVSSSAHLRSAGMSICSTSTETGLPGDTLSLGSMTASPVDCASGDLSNS